jgi:hypothetical protein
MSKQYDFDKQIPIIKDEKLSESVVKNNKKYDFVQEVWSNVARAATNIANTGYVRNMAVGSGVGSLVGGAAGIVNNSMKNDLDPTKKGTFGAMMKGAVKGSLVGGAAGGAARFALRRDIGKQALDKIYQNAAAQRLSMVDVGQSQQAIDDLAKFVNSGNKSRGLVHNYVGMSKSGQLGVRRGKNFIRSGDISDASNYT